MNFNLLPEHVQTRLRKLGFQPMFNSGNSVEEAQAYMDGLSGADFVNAICMLNTYIAYRDIEENPEDYQE